MTQNPQIRFKKDDGSDYPDWATMQLGNCIEECSFRNKDLKYIDVWSVSNKYGFMRQSEQFDNREVASKDISNYKIIYKDMYAYNPSRINIGSIARSISDNIGVVSPMYITFLIKELISAKYFDQYISTYKFQESVRNNTSGSVRDSLSFNSLSSFQISLPCLEEQEKIAEYFTALDNKIANLDAQLSLIKDYKKGMLQRMLG